MAVMLQARTLGLTQPPVTKEQPKVESYVKKPTIIDTVITPPDPIIKPQKPRTSVFSPKVDNYAGVEIIGDSNENCVQYSKRITGINKPIGNGGRSGINSDTPKVGAIIAERKLVHAAVVESITDTGVVVTEANFVKGHINRRFIPFNDILGYII